MASSGSIDWTATRNAIIRMAALDVQAIGAGVTMSAEMLADFDFSLNAMVKAWNASGIHVWTVTEATLFPQAETVKYTVGTNGTAHVTQSHVETALSADEASGGTVMSIDSNDGMTDGDNIGVVLDDGSIQWSTILSSTSTTVTLADELTDSAAEGNAVFAYTSKIVRPLRIVDARRYNISSAVDTPIITASRRDYQALPTKTGTGTINQIFYDKQNNTGAIYIWQPPATVIDDLVKFTWHRPIEDFDAAGDNPDLPVEWIQALRYNLAKSMITQFSPSRGRANDIKELAIEYLDLVKDHDREDEPIFFQPDMGP